MPGNLQETSSLKSLAHKVLLGNQPKTPRKLRAKDRGNFSTVQGGQEFPQGPTDSEITEELREAFNERAGIMEYDGGLSRTNAEQRATRVVWRYRCEMNKAAGVFISGLDAEDDVIAHLEAMHGAKVIHLERISGVSELSRA